MPQINEAARRLSQIPGLVVLPGAALSTYTRFGIGGPADIYVEARAIEPFVEALNIARSSGLAYLVIGSGTNLIVSDLGYRGIILRFRSERIDRDGCTIHADAGAELQAVVDFAIDCGLKGLETMAGIPGSIGAAVYGNAGAYGHSISELVHKVTFFDGESVHVFGNEDCEFRYRESVFKRQKDWMIFGAELRMQAGDPVELKKIAADILNVRNEKFPPAMKCAGSIFKNLLLNELPSSTAESIPAHVVREGKVPAAYFLEHAGAKGMARGNIHVAPYHANLIYNDGAGTAEDLCILISQLKSRVREKFGFELEEEVQYVGFSNNDCSRNGGGS